MVRLDEKTNIVRGHRSASRGGGCMYCGARSSVEGPNKKHLSPFTGIAWGASHRIRNRLSMLETVQGTVREDWTHNAGDWNTLHNRGGTIHPTGGRRMGVPLGGGARRVAVYRHSSDWPQQRDGAGVRGDLQPPAASDGPNRTRCQSCDSKRRAAEARP